MTWGYRWPSTHTAATLADGIDCKDFVKNSALVSALIKNLPDFKRGID